MQCLRGRSRSMYACRYDVLSFGLNIHHECVQHADELCRDAIRARILCKWTSWDVDKAMRIALIVANG